MFLISIIIPVYNSNIEFLKKTLRSVKNQTYKKWECLIVNDGTNDENTLFFLKSLRNDCQYRIIDQENRGLGPSRNTGTANAKGDFILFLDADDWLADNALEKIDENLAIDLDVLNFNFSYVYQNKVKLNTNYYIDLKNIRNWGIATSWSKVYNRNFINKNSVFFFDSKLPHEDEPHWLLVCLYLKSYRSINESLIFYNKMNFSSITKTTPYKFSIQSLIEYISMIEPIINQIEPSIFFYEYISKNLTLFYLPIISLLLDDESYNDYYNNYKKIIFLKQYLKYKNKTVSWKIKIVILKLIYTNSFRKFSYIIFKLFKPILKRIFLKDAK